MKFSEDLNLIEVDENFFIAYAPIKRAVASMNKDGKMLIDFLRKNPNFEIKNGLNENILNFLETLDKIGFIDDDINLVFPPEPEPNFEPTEVMLLPTYNCNLRCVYCYANSGDFSKITMNNVIGRAAVDYIISNSVKKGTNKAIIAFHGGGEPTLAWSVVIDVIDYAKKKSIEMDIDLKVQLTTNGILSNGQLDWLIDNNIDLQVSFDGPQDIQNAQRPKIDGTGSFEYVINTIQYLEEKHHAYGIQSVITKASVMRMREIVDFLHHLSSIKDIHFEPLFECGRCLYSGWEKPDASDFIKEYFLAWKHAASMAINLHTSLSNLESIHSSFCGAAGRNFIISPEGNITSCLEVPSFQDSRSEIFIYGSYNDELSKFIINREKLSYLASRNIYHMPACRNCFSAWNCGGDCLAKSLSLGKLFEPSESERCVMSRNLTLEQLKTILYNPEIGSNIGINVTKFQ